MDVFRQRCAEVRQSDDTRNVLMSDLLQALDDVQKTMDRNAFVLVLIDGDSLQFLNSLVRQGISGGDEAVKLLRKAVFEYLRHDPHYKHDHKIVIRTYANIRGLSKAYVDKGILPTMASFSDFVLGFNKAHPLCDFVDAGNHKEAADTKLKESLNLYIANVHCKQIIFGAPTDNAYASFLNSYIDVDAPARIRLLKGPPFSWEFKNILHKFQWTEFPNVFRNGLLSNDDVPFVQSNSLGSSVIPATRPGSKSGNQATLLPWKVNISNNVDQVSRRVEVVEDDSRSSSASDDRAQSKEVVLSSRLAKMRMDSNVEAPVQPLTEDHEIVASLVAATRAQLEKTPRALDFGAVKSQVEQKYRLRSDFWGVSEYDKWAFRSKNIIKWAIEDWIERTGNPPPRNATWMLRYFPEDSDPTFVIQNARWRTPRDADLASEEGRFPSQTPRNRRDPDTFRSLDLNLAVLGPVFRNAIGQRIDLPTEFKVNRDMINNIRNRQPRLCNMHHLRHACSDRFCEYDHLTDLKSAEFEALLYLSRSQPCSRGSFCDDPDCTRGHMCPHGPECSYGDRCRFSDTHVIDTKLDGKLASSEE